MGGAYLLFSPCIGWGAGDRVMRKRYKITTLTLRGHQLTFHVKEYSISEGDFVEFTDEKTGIPKKFHGSRCEIEEVTR